MGPLHQLIAAHQRMRLLETEALAKDIALRRARRELSLTKEVAEYEKAQPNR